MIRAPRVLVTVGGFPFAPISCDVVQTTHQSADTFKATGALRTPGGPNLQYLSDEGPMDVTVMASNSGPPSTLMFTGGVDHVSIDLDAGTFSLSGRDKTSKLTDKKTNEKWQNKTEADIIKELAGRAGLGTQIVGGDVKAGLEYKDDHNRISYLDTYHNVIIRMARHMGCVAYVKKDTLFVQPVDTQLGGNFNIFYVPPTAASYAQGNWVKLHLNRSVHLGRPITVNHKSFRHQKEDSVESEYKIDGKGEPLEFNLTAPNLKKEQQDQIAEAKANEAASHERGVRIDAPGDVTADPQETLTLTGTGTGFDQDYIISQIDHNWSQSGGYRMTLATRNADKKRGKAKKVK